MQCLLNEKHPGIWQYLPCLIRAPQETRRGDSILKGLCSRWGEELDALPMPSSFKHSGSAWYFMPKAATTTSARTRSPEPRTRWYSSASLMVSTLQVTLPALASLKIPSLDCPAAWHSQPTQPWRCSSHAAHVHVGPYKPLMCTRAPACRMPVRC
jgi:hypothetical protein